MKNWLGVLFLFLLFSCSTLREDPSIPAITADFYSAEALIDGERFRGLKIVSIKKGEPLANLNLQVQGFFSGTIKIDSRNCRINETVRYQSSALMKVNLQGEAERSCVVSFVVSPEYPRQSSQSVVVHGFKGALAIKVLGDEAWIGKTVTMPVGSDQFLDIDVNEQNPVKVFFSGCGMDYSDEVTPIDGRVKIPLNAVSVDAQGLCVVSGIVVSPEFEDLMIDVAIARYSKDFIDLPKPVVQIRANQVCVSAGSPVSFLMTDSTYSNKVSKCFDSPSYIRGITTKGRSFLGEIKNGVVEWK